MKSDKVVFTGSVEAYKGEEKLGDISYNGKVPDISMTINVGEAVFEKVEGLLGKTFNYDDF